jgi:capsular exopolysaccharide synthesis family protein
LLKNGVTHAPHNAATLRDYLHTVRRRKWIIILAAIVAPVVAGYVVGRQPVTYQASSDVLLSDQNLAAVLAGVAISDPLANGGLDTQADIARVPDIARRVLLRAHVNDRTPDAFLGQSSVAPRSTTNILTFTVTDRDPAMAVRLVNAYAAEYTNYRHALDTNSLLGARQLLERRIGTMQSQGTASGALYQNLVEKDQEIATMIALQGSNATVIRSATGAARNHPPTYRDAVLALILGLGLGVGLAFLRESLDTRVRSSNEIGERLGLPLLARIPEPPRRVRSADKLVMMVDPGSPEAESFRILRTNLELASLERDVRTIMVTSAVVREGKSTTAANLAVALARGGQDVALVDLDLRSPRLEQFFSPIRGRKGVTQVVLGHTALEEALFDVPIERPETADSRNGSGPVPGRLEVLFAGHIPPDPGEFVSTSALSDVLERLRVRADVVVVDTPPVLQVGDAIALSPKVDALIAVTRIGTLRRPMLLELRRALDATPTLKLGFVATGAQAEEGYADTYYSSYYSHYHRREETVR